MRELKNQRLRDRIKASGLKMYEVAEQVGICDLTLSHWLRHELTDERRERIETVLTQAEQARL